MCASISPGITVIPRTSTTSASPSSTRSDTSRMVVPSTSMLMPAGHSELTPSNTRAFFNKTGLVIDVSKFDARAAKSAALKVRGHRKTERPRLGDRGGQRVACGLADRRAGYPVSIRHVVDRGGQAVARPIDAAAQV